jgi:hypothetical protein
MRRSGLKTNQPSDHHDDDRKEQLGEQALNILDDWQVIAPAPPSVQAAQQRGRNWPQAGGLPSFIFAGQSLDTHRSSADTGSGDSALA